ncbi:MAG: hypothetical protein QOF78_3418 [Phycisphaerales bacterium]|nr:hypothetical protein [Phycisphaerales bacterium]
MLSAAISSPQQVTLHWLRLCGILALVLAAVALFFYFGREAHPAPLAPRMRNVQVGLLVTSVVLILGQLAFVQSAFRRTQRVIAAAAFGVAVLAGSNLLHEMMIPLGTATRYPPKFWALAIQTVAAAGIAAASGAALMDMLLGHAYLTASKMTIAPFRRLNLFVAAMLISRAVLAAAATVAMPRDVWMRDGLFILTRWLVGLLVPAVFVYMAHDCIKRRSTQSATGILYVAGVLIFVGEIIALYLVRSTALPF